MDEASVGYSRPQCQIVQAGHVFDVSKAFVGNFLLLAGFEQVKEPNAGETLGEFQRLVAGMKESPTPLVFLEGCPSFLDSGDQGLLLGRELCWLIHGNDSRQAVGGK